VDVDFATGLLVVGGVLAIAAGLSGLFHGTVLSSSVLAVATGVVLSLIGVLDVDPEDSAVVHAVELALVLTLFTDGLVAERELVQMHWGKPTRALVVAMPITLVLLALGAKLLFSGLSWAEAFLLGAVLAPTDPVVTSTVVTAERVPSLIRHTLNLESGLNDGLALPFVLILIALATPGAGAGSEALDQVAETAVGAVIGVALAVVAGQVLERVPGGGIEPRYEGVYGLGLALLAFGLAAATYGNGLIAAFVAGVALAVQERHLPVSFAHFNENVTAVFTVITFVLFGALVADTGYSGDALGIVTFIPFALLLARPISVWLAFFGSDLPRAQRLFVAWFGPKGVASMLFALFVLGSAVPGRFDVFEIASYVILASIAAHGLTDTVGARWIERRMENAPAPAGSGSQGL
jgi:NhaP-type Na+/H+ or K+/H+ antiporter